MLGMILIFFVIILMFVSTILYSISIILDSFISIFSNIEIIIQSFIALGTVSTVVVALLKDEIIEYFKPIKLEIRNNELIGERGFKEIGNYSYQAIYFHLEVYNFTKSRNIENAKVNLKGFNKKVEGHSHPIIYPGESLFHLTPFEIKGLSSDFTKKLVFDFGCVINGTIENYFIPSIIRSYGNENNNTLENQRVIYNIEVLANNIYDSFEVFFQVYNDGVFVFDSEEMRKHLQITKVNGINDFREPIKYEDN